MTTSPYAYVDHVKLVADLQADDPAAITWAYRKVFGDQIGRLVLTHQLAEAGVGSPRRTDMSAIERADHDGAARHALHLLNLAGFGPMSAAHAVAADRLEGQDDGSQRTYPHASADTGAFSGPDADAHPLTDA